jgi:hypothetical protein
MKFRRLNSVSVFTWNQVIRSGDWLPVLGPTEQATPEDGDRIQSAECHVENVQNSENYLKLYIYFSSILVIHSQSRTCNVSSSPSSSGSVILVWLHYSKSLRFLLLLLYAYGYNSVHNSRIPGISLGAFGTGIIHRSGLQPAQSQCTNQQESRAHACTRYGINTGDFKHDLHKLPCLLLSPYLT